MEVIEERPENHNFPIRPEDIKKPNGLNGTFGKQEVEEATEGLILFCKQRGGWYPFTIKELLSFYERNELDTKLMLFGLLGSWLDDALFIGGIREDGQFLVIYPDGMYRFTAEFINRCGKNIKKQ